MILTIEEMNKLHAQVYCVGEHRRYPKRGIVSFSTVATAAKWLRKNTKNGKLIK